MASVSILIYCGLKFCPRHFGQVYTIVKKDVAFYLAEAGVQRARYRIAQGLLAANPDVEDFPFPETAGTQTVHIETTVITPGSDWDVTSSATYENKTITISASIEYNAPDYKITSWSY